MFEEILKEFKANETPESIYPLTQNPALVTVMLAWRTVHVSRRSTASDPPQDIPSRWTWLWDHARYEESDLGAAIGDSPGVARRLLDQLRAHRLVYPDGTVHKFGEQYARTLIMERLQGKKRGK